jgi:hypothetical protein
MDAVVARRDHFLDFPLEDDFLVNLRNSRRMFLGSSHLLTIWARAPLESDRWQALEHVIEARAFDEGLKRLLYPGRAQRGVGSAALLSEDFPIKSMVVEARGIGVGSRQRKLLA